MNHYLKVCCLAAVLLLLCSQVKAQKNQWGLKLGSTLSNISYNGAPPFDISTKFVHALHIGALTDIPLGERLQLRTELLVGSKGYRFDEAVRFNLLYASLPVIPTYTIFHKLAAGIGIDLGIRIADWAVQNGQGIITNGIYDRLLDLGLVFRTQYRLHERWAIDARYVHGLSSIQEIYFTDEQGFLLGSSQERNRAFMFSIEFLLQSRG